MSATSSSKVRSVDAVVQLRPIPYPYRAMLAICSDLDETADRYVYCEIMRFLNTTETTAMGPGIGLEVGNSIYFDMPPDQFAYWNTDDAGREMVRTLIRSGHIDCLHSYGDLATTRKHAARALDELTHYNCNLQVWIDHGTAATNFGADIMRGHGDEVGHEAYHADLTVGYAIRYVWRGRITSVTGQDVPARLGGLFNGSHPIASGRTLLKEAAKQGLARIGNVKYAMHGPNQTLRPAVLRDESQVYEFVRCNPHWGGVTSCEQGRYVGEVLTSEMLNRLVERGGTCVLYTHLGKIDDPRVPFGQKAVKAFRQLAEEFYAGRVLVTTTRRLLAYCRAMREVTCECIQDEGCPCILVNTGMHAQFVDRLSKGDLNGLTFYMSKPETASVVVDGQKVATLRRNAPDHTGRPSVSLDWPRLEFPKI
jgi:hypothetical protein